MLLQSFGCMKYGTEISSIDRFYLDGPSTYYSVAQFEIGIIISNDN